MVDETKRTDDKWWERIRLEMYLMLWEEPTTIWILDVKGGLVSRYLHFPGPSNELERKKAMQRKLGYLFFCLILGTEKHHYRFLCFFSSFFVQFFFIRGKGGISGIFL